MAEKIYRRDRFYEASRQRYLAKLHQSDGEMVERYLDELLGAGYTTARLDKIMSTLVVIARAVGGPLGGLGSDDIRRYLAVLARSSYSPWTKHDHQLILKKYLRWLGKAGEADLIKPRKPKNDRLPEEVLAEEEVKRLVGAAYCSRDRAFALGLYESGCRIGEFLPLRLKHLSFDRYGAVLIVDGKTGMRRIRLVASALSLQRWIEEHPRKGDPEAYLWCKVPWPNNPKWMNEHLSYGFVVRLLRELAAKAGIRKGVNPHAFRHARATFMARHLKEPEMREYFGWGRDSEMSSVYVHLSGRDVDNSVLSIYGIREAEESREPVLRIEACPRCQENNDSASRFCRRCGLPLGDKGIAALDRLEELVVELLKAVSESSPGVKEKFREIVRKEGMEELFA